VDIEISGLSKFLATIPISKQGAAFIMNRDGLAIALPGLEAMISQDAEQPTLPQISTINNDRIKGLIGPNSAEQRLTHQQKTFRQFDLDGETQYGVLSSFAVGDEFWVIGVYAPAVDFQGQIRAQFYRYRLQIVGIWALVGLLAIPLVFRITRPMMRIYEQATRDELTQLPNRVEFLRRAKKLVLQAQRKKQEIAVAMMDLDGFKGINDTYGHKAGDEVLTIVGQRLASVVRSADLVGRLGGDEFALILTGVGEKEAMQLVERIRKRISQEPIYSDDEVYVVGATAGVAMNQWGENVLETLAKADQALLDAKTIGKNCTLAFSAQGVDTIIYNHARAS
jgi:diguanylate cyclase (GGDEF)-like protein